MAVLILNIAFLIVTYIVIFAAIEIRRKFTTWLYGKIENRPLSVVWPLLNALILLFIFFPIAGFLVTTVIPNLFSLLGSKLVPDYFVGARLHSLWWWLGIVVLPILLYIAWREIFYKTTPSFEIKETKKGVLLGLLITVILISIGYIAYTGSSFLQTLQSVTPGEKIEKNILIDNKLGYSITLYPRNGIWKRQIESLGLPSSEDGYNLRVYIGEEKPLNGKEYFYNESNGFLPLKPDKTQKIGKISSNNINWILYQHLEEPTHYPKLEAIGTYQEKIAIIFFNYENGRSQRKSTKAEADFKKMVSSFKFLDYLISTPAKQEDWKTYTNQSLGFSFKYPLSWLDAETNILSTKTSVTIKDGKEFNDLITRLEVTRGVYYNQSLQREMTFNELINKQSFPSEALTSEKVNLKNWEGMRFTHHVHGVGYFVTYIFLAKPSDPTDIISFVYRHSNDPVEYKSEMPKTLDQILSTFKFVK